MTNDIRRGYEKDTLHTTLVSEDLRSLARKTIQKQKELGEHSILQGYFSQHWTAVQNLHDKRDDDFDIRTDWSSRLELLHNNLDRTM